MNIPQIGQLNDVFGQLYFGFYWHGMPYKLSQTCTQNEFNHFWEKGWNQKFNSRPDCHKHYQEPFATIYKFAYNQAPSNPASFRSIALKAVKDSIPF